MEIQGKTVLLLGAGGLVGTALARRLLEERPRRMVLLSLSRKESAAAAAELKPLAGRAPTNSPMGKCIFPLQIQR